MNSRQRARLDSYRRVKVFGGKHSASFVPRAGKTASKAQDLWTELSGIITDLEKDHATQTGGQPAEHTVDKATARDATMRDLREVNRSMAAIAEDRHEPGLRERFRMPNGHNDAEIAARARSFATAIEKMHLTDALVDLEPSETIIADLRARVAEFEAADDFQAGAQQGRSGATRRLTQFNRRAATVVKNLDAAVNNRFRTNATILGEWKTASHVERAARPKRRPPALKP